MIDYNAQEAMRSQLSGDERLLWAGAPKRGLRVQPADLIVLPFSLMWAGFAVFWEYQVIRAGAPLVMRLFGLPFLVVGAYLVVGRFFADAWRRNRTSYGLTDQRALIVSGRQVRSLDLRNLGEVSLSERSDGSGTIVFGPAGSGLAWNWATGWAGSRRVGPPAFEAVPWARQVYDRIRAAQQAAAATR